MRIGELARRCDVNPKTVRYYEELGLLPKPPRTVAGHRIYGNEDLRRLQFIRRAKAVGLPLAGLREIVPQVDGGRCDHARARLRELIANQLADIERRFRELQTFRATLRRQMAALSEPVASGASAPPGCNCLDGSGPDPPILPATVLVRRRQARKSRPEGGEAM